MATPEISRDKVEAVFPKVADTIADALGCDVEEVHLDVSLIDDLYAESIDFLDLVFRLERTFGMKIPRGRIVEEARGDMGEDDFQAGGVVTDAGMERLREFLSEVAPERFESPMRVADIPHLFTAETFCKVVVRAQQETATAG